MKKATILSGSHFAGKSLTIRHYLKPLLGISQDAHKFTLNGKTGFIISQSYEESGRDIAKRIPAYAHYDLLVFASRPAAETGSRYNQLKSALIACGFTIVDFNISNPKEAPQKAKDIFDELMK